FVFIQAEDGIRYFHVTGVQTCALPISTEAEDAKRGADLTVGALDGERVLEAIEPGTGRDLGLAEEVVLVALGGGEAGLRGRAEREVVEHVHLHPDGDLFGDVEGRLEPQAHVRPGLRGLVAAQRRARRYRVAGRIESAI